MVWTWYGVTPWVCGEVFSSRGHHPKQKPSKPSQLVNEPPAGLATHKLENISPGGHALDLVSRVPSTVYGARVSHTHIRPEKNGHGRVGIAGRHLRPTKRTSPSLLIRRLSCPFSSSPCRPLRLLDIFPSDILPALLSELQTGTCHCELPDTNQPTYSTLSTYLV